MIRRLRRNWPLAAALTTMGVGLILVLTQLYTVAWADNIVGPLMVAALIPVYAFTSFAMTPNRRRS